MVGLYHEFVIHAVGLLDDTRRTSHASRMGVIKVVIMVVNWRD